MRCPNCRSDIPDDAKFCTACGWKLTPSVPSSGAQFCQACGSSLEPNTRFCTKCGTPVPGSADPSPAPRPRRRPLSSAAKFLCAAVCFILFDLLILFVVLKDAADLKHAAAAEIDHVNSQILSLSEQMKDAEDKLQNNDYTAASLELAEILSVYSDLYAEYPQDILIPYADNAYGSYCESVLKQAADLEALPASADTYTQISDLLTDSLSLTEKLAQNGISEDASALQEYQAEISSSYKEKYIYLFNDLRCSENWSYDTARQYMQEADAIGIIPSGQPDDPLTLRYAYSFAVVTHQELKTQLHNNSLSYNDAASRIISAAKNADYNPILMVDLARYLDAVYDTRKAGLIKDACRDVYDYLAYSEYIYINPADFLVDEKSGNNASSTIALEDFYYFNDFDNYSVSNTNGISSEGRQYIRNTSENAINSL